MDQEKITSLIHNITNGCANILHGNAGNKLTPELVQGILLHTHNVIIDNMKILEKELPNNA